MTTVNELVAGDVAHGLFDLEGRSGLALYVAQTDHPVYTNLRLVIWRMGNGRWSHDALDAWQDVGPIIHRGGPVLVRHALGEPGDWLKEMPA